MSTLRPSAPRVSRLDAQSAYSTSNISKPVSLGTKGQRSANAKVLRNVIGIDLGTTYSVVGAYRNGGVKILANDQGNRTTPSVVAFTDNDRLIGETAINQIARNPENTVFDVKRLIGRNFDDESVQNDLRHWPFKVIKVKGNYPMIEVMHRNEKRTFFPEQISSMVLGKMQEIAADNLGAPVDGAVITVPAHFNDAQRQATKDAGMIAGLHVLRVINEPTAAAIAYGMEVNKSDKPINALIFDLGGGTFDVSVVQIENGVFQVRSTGGDTHLGGDDFDNRLVDWCVQDIKTKNGGVDISTNPRSLNRLRMQCERAKRTLSTTLETTIDIDGLFEGVDYSTTLTRARFNELNMHYFNSTMVATQRVIDDSHLSKKDINEVVLVGGSARIPKIREMLSELFDGKTLNQSVNPDEAVAIGAAMEAGVLANLADDMIFSDVTPLTLGIETAGGVFTPIIPRNTTFPARATQTFTTMKDNQRNVLIAVYEGERGLVADNHLLGNVRLDQIPLAKRGVPEIEVEYMMDADGILNVSGCVTLTGNKKEITITNTFRRRKSETDRLIAEAQEFAKQDAEMKKAKVEQVKMENATVYHAEVPVSVAGRSAALKKTAASPRSGPSSPSRARRALSQSRTGGSIAPSRTRSVALSRPRGSKAPSKASRSAHLSRATSRAGGSASPPKATMSPLSLQAPSSIQGTAAPSHIDISSRQVNVRSSVAPSQIRGSHSPSQAPPHTAGSVLQSELGRSASPSRTASYTPGSVSPSKVSRSPSPSRAPSHTAGSVLPLEFGRSASQSRTASYTPGSLSPSKVSRSPSPSRAPSYTQGPVSPSKVSRSPSPSPAPSYTQGPVSISKVSRSPSPSRAPSYTQGPVSISKVSRSPSPSRAPSHTAGSVLPLEFGCSVSPSRAPSRAPSYTPGSVSPLRIIRSPSPSRAPSASRGSISPFRSGISPSTSRALSYTPESGLLSQLDHSVSPSRAPSGTRGSISPSHGDFTPSASDSPSRAQGSMSPSHLDGSATPSGTPLRSPESVSPSTGTRLSPKSPTRRFASPSPSITRSHVSGSESPSSIRDPAILSSAPSSTPGSVCPSRVDGAAASHIPKARGLVGKSAATGSSSPTHLEVVSANKRGPTVGSSGTSMIPSRPGSSNSLRASNSGGFFSRAEKFVADLTRRSQNSKAARE